MMHFLHLYWIPLLFFGVGLLLWLLPLKSPRLSEFGRITMAVGLLVSCLSLTQHRIWP
jgi:Na+/phosphate symporter